MSRMACSAGALLLMVFCLIFVPYGHCDEPEKLPYENHSICPKGADGRHDTRVAFDLWYAKNWSLWLDFTIMLKTIPAVLARRGAY